METTRMIEEYLQGALSDEERQVLEERAGKDKEFNALIILHKEINESVRENDLHLFHHLINKVSSVYFQTTSFSSQEQRLGKMKIWPKRLLRFAAILVIIACSGIILKYSLSRSAAPDKLYRQYYAAYDADIVLRSAQKEMATLDSALISYSRKDYSVAMGKLNTLTQGDKTDYVAWFYRGLTCLATDETSEAINSFRVIPAIWNNAYSEHRDWYLALALLHDGKTNEAIKAFDQMKVSNGYYADRADKILKRLKY